jgi:cell division protease FtsH
MRAGRFDRQIDVGLPDVKEREAIFGVHTRKLRCEEGISHEFLAKQTAGFSGADIANVCNEAALIAARHNKKKITKEDFLAAIDRIVGGLEKKNTVMTAKERYATAVHEAGHAAVMWLLPECDPVVKVTIIPRGKSLGATWYLPEERTHITSGNLRQRMSGMVAGRVAEQTFLGTIGTGALNDLERTSNMAYAMVAYYGMSEKIGNVSYYDSTGQRDAFTKPFSEQTAREIDQEVRRLIDEATDEARTLISTNREKVEQLAKLLVERETVFAEDIEKIFGRSAHDERKAAEATEATPAVESATETPAATDQPQSEGDLVAASAE